MSFSSEKGVRVYSQVYDGEIAIGEKLGFIFLFPY